ncbi:ABC transporter permease [Jiangella sp. DSM 45060]|uniref:ABC transporter permease n=1 Tax=Jiangella sp. DSM 45060 TaxID=1798224 RepID=UPI00087BEE69|nr:ABC transporter permease [Jiangella sp. DSM 45060]SDT12924.1 ABC-2 type transport system permease protein [Jiangella sp. DSM 45060]
MSGTTATTPALPDREALRDVLTERPGHGRAPAPAAVLAFAWRGILKIRHVPEQLLDVTVTPVLFVLMFTYLFGGSIAGSTGEYLHFVLPGILAMSVLFTTMYSGVALNTDLTRGAVDRFRTLPIWKPAPLVGALAGDTVRYLAAATVIVGLGLALGYRPDNGAGGVLAALALVVVFAFGLSWVYITLGPVLRSPNAVTNAGFMTIFPLTFLTNVFVEPETLPRPLEVFVAVNPVSHLVSATRGLMNGSLATSDLVVVLATAAALTAVLAPLASHLYRARS